MNKKLIINADDYGICREVNKAIEHLIIEGKLQNVSVLANSWFYEEAVDFLRTYSSCSVGVHLNVVEGIALSPNENVSALLDHNQQFVNLKQIFLRWIRSPLAVSRAIETEWRKQIERLLNDGLVISHADSHQHIHAFPPFWRILLRLCHDFKIPTLRSAIETNRIKKRKIPAFALAQSNRLGKLLTPKKELICNDHLLGFKRAGFYGEEEILADLTHLREGVTELVIHPSLEDHLPYQGFYGGKEYQALLSPKIKQRINDLEIEISSWSNIGKTKLERLNDGMALEKL